MVDDESKVFVDQILRDEACYIFWEPNPGLIGGGMQLLHLAARSLLKAGACVRMSFVRPAYAKDLSEHRRVVAAARLGARGSCFESSRVRRPRRVFTRAPLIR